MNTRRKKRLALAVALIGGVAAIASLLLYALNSNLNLFYTPTEIVQGKKDTGVLPEIGQRIRVGGMVTIGSMLRDPESLHVEFAIHDSLGGEIIVTYDDLLPDLFREGQGIVAQGILIEGGKLQATEVLAKHDENYMPPEVAEAMGQTHEKLDYKTEQKSGY
ncbi:cytochrome c maturation protein CcmE [Shewanella benthica]|uniref:Cytochrome c-type biogenesis protein CcmE n=1 Tax=Shewanella benthica KT99 TaxID=314608 RepID=A9DHV9_9GAMM|nr:MULTISPECIES: cytochrome c maturation protein CcmE [Shewanella]EDP99149.1 cytochrome c biogenesis protein CcmE [Shewanella benthica KT99]MBE7216435.1 cytochrome c maturation protein CcmE [Shewanella benthica]MCJ8302537.1 cytochrome c maturation protein CcmE [Shewanella sp.]MCL1064428.1 cytochrome c maturation protein CcmE [Shewanella benthica]PHQ73080.1 MAG: cytochrome c maturation protein CcmE [Shewanella sp.]